MPTLAFVIAAIAIAYTIGTPTLWFVSTWTVGFLLTLFKETTYIDSAIDEVMLFFVWPFVLFHA